MRKCILFSSTHGTLIEIDFMLSYVVRLLTRDIMSGSIAISTP